MIRDNICDAVEERQDMTSAIVVVTEKQIGIEWCTLDEIEGDGEEQRVKCKREEVGGTQQVVSVFRWPVGTPDEKIIGDMTEQIEETVEIVSGSSQCPAVPLRHCWGRVGSTFVDDEFVQRLAVLIAHRKEQIEARMRTIDFIPTFFRISMNDYGPGVNWCLGMSMSPDKVQAVVMDDAYSAMQCHWDLHIGRYETPPKTVLDALVTSRMTVQEMSTAVAMAAMSVAHWSHPYDDIFQQCFWVM
jgi:hypothetical protein